MGLAPEATPQPHLTFPQTRSRALQPHRSTPDDHSPLAPPLPIPNRTVKRRYADDSTELPCESRSSSGTPPTTRPTHPGWAFGFGGARRHGVARRHRAEEVKVGGRTGANTRNTQGYGVKPHGRLVPVSSTRYRASTPGLSTWWSATTLQGGLAPGRSPLQACFPLRCFQRLSLPYLATRQCDWRHNRYTSGTSTPVLSY